MNEIKLNSQFINDVKSIIVASRSNAIRSVDRCRVEMYWNIGRRIFEEEQGGKERADYGDYLIPKLASSIEPEFGSGFSKRQLFRARQFYRLYPIVSAVRTQLNWSQYKLLISIDNPHKREYYEHEAVNSGWTGRELERQINSHLWERLLKSNDQEAVLAVARREKRPQDPKEVVKDPMFLEFLGLKRKSEYYESDLENAIIDHLQEFLLEMGNGFTFVARQKRLLLEDDEFFADLVLYNRYLRAFAVIEIKTGKISHRDIGQLQMYVNYYDRFERLPDENPTIGILLCASKNDTMVKLSLPKENKTILASEYRLHLPSESQLEEEIDKVKKLLQDNIG